eukprot:Rmarinus@m.6743
MGNSASINAKREAGNKCFVEGDFDNAVLHYTLAINETPHGAKESEKLFSNRSAALFGCGCYGAALKDAYDCVAINPRWDKGYYRAGIACQALGHHHEALMNLTKGIVLSPQDPSLQKAYQHVLSKVIEMPPAIRGAGYISCWGKNATGECGVEKKESVSRPTVVDMIRGGGAVDVACGSCHTVIVLLSGEVFSFGDNKYGQCGHPIGAGFPTIPLPIGGLLGHRAKSVACGAGHTVILTDDQRVFTFGVGMHGQLGHGEFANETSGPREITTLKKTAVIGVACGMAHTILLDVHGMVWGFGWNVHGQLGLGHKENMNAPIQIVDVEGPVTHVHCGAAHTVFVTDAGGIWTTGSGSTGQLGHGSTEDICRPRGIETLKDKRVVCAYGGEEFTICLTSRQQVYSWGLNNAGQLGLGDLDARSLPVAVAALSGAGVEAVTCSQDKVLATTRDGKVYWWGLDTDPTTGANLPASAQSPHVSHTPQSPPRTPIAGRRATSTHSPRTTTSTSPVSNTTTSGNPISSPDASSVRRLLTQPPGTLGQLHDNGGAAEGDRRGAGAIAGGLGDFGVLGGTPNPNPTLLLSLSRRNVLRLEAGRKHYCASYDFTDPTKCLVEAFLGASRKPLRLHRRRHTTLQSGGDAESIYNMRGSGGDSPCGSSSSGGGDGDGDGGSGDGDGNGDVNSCSDLLVPAGSRLKFRLTAFSYLGARVSSGGDRFVATVFSSKRHRKSPTIAPTTATGPRGAATNGCDETTPSGATVDDNMDGTYDVLVQPTPTAEGPYLMLLSLGGLPVADTPVHFTVSSGEGVASACEILLYQGSTPAGSVATFSIRVCDKYGNPVVKLPESVENSQVYAGGVPRLRKSGAGAKAEVGRTSLGPLAVRIEGLTQEVSLHAAGESDATRGTCVASFTETLAQSLTVHVFYDDEELRGSPFAYDIIPAAPARIMLTHVSSPATPGMSPDTSTSLSNMAARAINVEAGDSCTLHLRAYDAYGNLSTSLEDDVSVSAILSGTSGEGPDVTFSLPVSIDAKSKLRVIEWTPTIAGSYSLLATLKARNPVGHPSPTPNLPSNDCVVLQSSIVVTCLPAPPAASECRLVGAGLRGGTCRETLGSSEPVSFFVITRDRFGNPVPKALWHREGDQNSLPVGVIVEKPTVSITLDGGKEVPTVVELCTASDIIGSSPAEGDTIASPEQAAAFRCTYAPVGVGKYNIQCKILGSHVCGSPAVATFELDPDDIRRRDAELAIRKKEEDERVRKYKELMDKLREERRRKEREQLQAKRAKEEEERARFLRETQERESALAAERRKKAEEEKRRKTMEQLRAEEFRRRKAEDDHREKIQRLASQAKEREFESQARRPSVRVGGGFSVHFSISGKGAAASDVHSLNKTQTSGSIDPHQNKSLSHGAAFSAGSRGTMCGREGNDFSACTGTAKATRPISGRRSSFVDHKRASPASFAGGGGGGESAAVQLAGSSAARQCVSPGGSGTQRKSRAEGVLPAIRTCGDSANETYYSPSKRPSSSRRRLL